jgi:hypothetical protein
MVSSSRARRGVAAAVVAAAVASMGAASAEAKTVTVTDDSAADFAQGTQSSTVVRSPGSVELARTLEERFDGAPAGWTSTVWSTLTTRPPTVANGSLVVDGERADSGVAAGLGSTMEFRATFGTDPHQHVGFATDFDKEAWAVFSTGSSGGLLKARVFDGTAVVASNDLVGLDASVPHDYRIERTATGGFAFFVDGGPVTLTATPAAVTTAMRPQASDFAAAGQAVSVDSILLNTHKTPGTFTSRPLDAGDSRVTGLSLAATNAGTAISYETRTADTQAELDAAPWAALGAAGAVASPPKRFLQYRAALSTTVATETPSLDKVVATFTLEDDAPPAPSDPGKPSTGSGSGSGSTPTGTAPDRTAPKVLVTSRSARVTKGGIAKLGVRCPRSEQTCEVSVKLKLRGKRVARKTLTVSSGATQAFRLKLSGAARRKLAARSSLAAFAVVSAEDAAGNEQTTTHRVTLLAPTR